MKVATRPAAPAATLERLPPVPAPLRIDELGMVRRVFPDVPQDDEGWIALVDRLPAGGALVVAKLVACLSRVDAAQGDVETALRHVGQRRRDKPGEPLPAPWITRLEAIYCELFDARCSLDDAAHQAALASPRWVVMSANNSGGDDRPVLAEEKSWLRVLRIFARALEMPRAAGFDMDRCWDLLGEMDAARPMAEEDAAGATEQGRRLMRSVVRERYGAKENS